MMQLLSWPQKKLLSDASPEKTLRISADANDRDTSVESDRWLPYLKNRRNERHTARQMDSAIDGSRVAGTWSRPTLNQYFREDERRQNVPTCLEINPWLLTIGSLGVGELLGKNDESPVLDEVRPIDILKIQQELQKDLYLSPRQPLQNEFPASSINVHREFAKFHDAERDLTEKQVFPLQKYLEVPVTIEQTSDVAKKKHVFVKGWSSLVTSAVFPQRFLHHGAKETVKRTRVLPFLLEKLLKIHSADSGYLSRYQGNLKKFLQRFRKTGAVSDKDNLKADLKDNDSSRVTSLKCRGDVGGTDDYQLPARHHLAHRLDPYEMQGSPFIRQQPCDWNLQLDDVQVFKSGKEYWIKTDDECTNSLSLTSILCQSSQSL